MWPSVPKKRSISRVVGEKDCVQVVGSIVQRYYRVKVLPRARQPQAEGLKDSIQVDAESGRRLDFSSFAIQAR